MVFEHMDSPVHMDLRVDAVIWLRRMILGLISPAPFYSALRVTRLIIPPLPTGLQVTSHHFLTIPNSCSAAWDKPRGFQGVLVYDG